MKEITELQSGLQIMKNMLNHIFASSGDILKKVFGELHIVVL